MAKKTTEKEAAEKTRGFEMPIDEESAGKVLDTIYKSALNGVPKVSRSVDEMVTDYMGKAKSPDEAAKALAKWQVMKCGTSGFLTGLGGLITLPVAIPANISSVMYVQMRMIACIAKMGCYDVTSDQVLRRWSTCASREQPRATLSKWDSSKPARSPSKPPSRRFPARHS